MSFYLLKSTNDREKTGDVLLLKNEISSVQLIKRITKKETYFCIIISMKSSDDFKGLFNTEEEAKAVIAELTYPDCSAESINEMLPQISSNVEKEEALEKMKELLCS